MLGFLWMLKRQAIFLPRLKLSTHIVPPNFKCPTNGNPLFVRIVLCLATR
ncbi:hypothetical protein Hanom_Chr15g01337441 [Helianthus anomalus]